MIINPVIVLFLIDRILLDKLSIIVHDTIMILNWTKYTPHPYKSSVLLEMRNHNETYFQI